MVVVTQPRVRVADSFAESANDSQSLFPIQSLLRTRMPCTLFAHHMGSTPTRKPQTLCERFWGNLGGIWRGLVEDVGCMELDELLILSVQSQWKNDIPASVSELAHLQSILGNEQQCVRILLDSPRLSHLIVVIQLRGGDDWALQMLG